MRILLVDDQELVRECIALILRKEIAIEVLTAHDIASAVAAVKQGRPFDIILLDYGIPGMKFLSGLATLLDQSPDTPVAILSGNIPQDALSEALASGAAGYLPKTLSTKALVAALRMIIAGKVFAPLRLKDETGPDLTRREADVLRGLCRNQTNKEIARDLQVQEVTVKLHVSTLLLKLGARNRNEAAILAIGKDLAS